MIVKPFFSIKLKNPSVRLDKKSLFLAEVLTFLYDNISFLPDKKDFFVSRPLDLSIFHDEFVLTYPTKAVYLASYLLSFGELNIDVKESYRKLVNSSIYKNSLDFDKLMKEMEESAGESLDKIKKQYFDSPNSPFEKLSSRYVVWIGEEVPLNAFFSINHFLEKYLSLEEITYHITPSKVYIDFPCKLLDNHEKDSRCRAIILTHPFYAKNIKEMVKQIYRLNHLFSLKKKNKALFLKELLELLRSVKVEKI